MSNTSGVIHPEIGSLIRKRDQIQFELSRRNYLRSLRLMKLLLMELKPNDFTSDAGKEILSEIERQLNTIRNLSSKGYHYVNAMGIINAYTIAKAHVFEDLYMRINTILWNGGYLLAETYSKFYDPSGGRKSGR